MEERPGRGKAAWQSERRTRSDAEEDGAGLLQHFRIAGFGPGLEALVGGQDHVGRMLEMDLIIGFFCGIALSSSMEVNTRLTGIWN